MGLGEPSKVMDGCAFPRQLGTGAPSCWPQPISGQDRLCLGRARLRAFEMQLAPGGGQGERLVPRERRGPVSPPAPLWTLSEPVGQLVHLFIEEIYRATPALSAEAAVMNDSNKK